MTISTVTPGPRQQAPGHRFALGQTVQFKDRFGLSAVAAQTYRVTGTLPHRDNSLQYRIRSDNERHERVTTEDNLEPGATSPLQENTLLIERIFHNGQGAEAQQSRGSKAETGEGAAES